MKQHMANTRKHLGELHGLAAQTEASERNILAAAEKRHGVVVSKIDELQPGIEAADDEQHDAYLQLVSERGQLEVVMAKARQALR